MQRRTVLASLAAPVVAGCGSLVGPQTPADVTTLSLGETFSTREWDLTVTGYDRHEDVGDEVNAVVVKLRARNTAEYANHYRLTDWDLVRGNESILAMAQVSTEYPDRVHWADAPQADTGETLALYGELPYSDGRSLDAAYAVVEPSGPDAAWRLA